jgi:hypothetical protein
VFDGSGPLRFAFQGGLGGGWGEGKSYLMGDNRWEIVNGMLMRDLNWLLNIVHIT